MIFPGRIALVFRLEYGLSQVLMNRFLAPTLGVIGLFLIAYPLQAREFTVVVYNVENLFDVDEVAVFRDYQPAGDENPEGYTPAQFLTKLRAIRQTLSHFNDGQGPEIILFQEIEADQTPHGWDGDLPGFLAAAHGRSVEEILTGEIPDKWRGVPAEAWLYKKLADAGMHEYFVDVAEYNFDPEGRPIAHVNVIFSKFPFLERRTHILEGERGMQEAVVDVDGYPLYLFNNHWKAGASNPDSERIRRELATLLRTRIEAILGENPNADLVVAGDFNSHYNQSTVFPDLQPTALNDILGSQGDVLAIRDLEGPPFYNLWFEVPEEERGSEVWRGDWGTLMQILISRGLYDFRGIQYVDGSFGVLVVPGFNVDEVTGIPLDWVGLEDGGGVSDHLPVYARFRTVAEDDSTTFKDLEEPNRDAEGSKERRAVNFANAALDRARSAEEVSQLRSAENYNRTFHVTGKVVRTGRPFEIEVQGDTYVVWSFDGNLRDQLNEVYESGNEIDFFGTLNQYRGRWQFVIHDSSWLEGVTADTPTDEPALETVP